MSDAANLLSILRGEAPVPPLDSSAHSPPRPLHSSTALPRSNSQDVDHLTQLLNRLGAPSSTSTLHVETRTPPPPAPPAAAPPSSSSLLSILSTQKPQGTPPRPQQQPEPRETPKSTPPNFNFVSPFDLLSSALKSSPSKPTPASPSPSPSSSKRPVAIVQPTSASFPRSYLSYPSLSGVPLSPSSQPPQGLSLPPPPSTSSSSNEPLQPQRISISSLSDTHLESLTHSPPNLIPITLFSPLLIPNSQKGNRKLCISEHAMSYIVQPSSTGSGGSGGKKKKGGGGGLATPGNGGAVRIIDRDSGSRVLIEKPFSSSPSQQKELGQVHEVTHVEFSKEASREGERALLVVGARGGQLAVWMGNDGFDPVNGKEPNFKPSFILSATTSSLLGTGKTKIVLAKLHPLFPKIPELCFALEDGLVGLVDVQEAVGKKGGGSVSFEDLDQVEGIRWIEANEDVRDVTYSADGTNLAILGSSNYSIHSTPPSSIPSLVLSSPLPPSTPSSLPCEILFLDEPTPSSPSKFTPRGIAISSALGTEISLIPLDFSSSSSPPSRSPTVSITLEPPTIPEDIAYHFSNLSIDVQNSILYCSSSLRGSIFGFKLDYPVLQQGERSIDPTSSTSVSTRRTIRVEKILETPHPNPIIQYVLDPSPSPSSTNDSTGGGGALILHSQGIQNMSLRLIPKTSPRLNPPIDSSTMTILKDTPLLSNPFSPSSSATTTLLPPSEPHPLTNGFIPSPSPSTPPPQHDDSNPSSPSELEKYLATGRRMSLEGSIHVQSEVEVEEERVDPVSWEFMRRASIPILEHGNEEEIEKKKDREVEEVLSRRRRMRATGQEEGKGRGQDKLPSIDEPTKGDIANAFSPSVTPLTTPGLFGPPREGLGRRDEEGEGEIKLSGSVVNKAIKSMKLATAKKSQQQGDGTAAFSNTYKNYSMASGEKEDSKVDGGRGGGGGGPFINPSSSTTTMGSGSMGSTTTSMVGKGAAGEKERVVESDLPRQIERVISEQFEKYLQRFEEGRSGDQTLSTAREETLLKLVSQSVVKGTGRALETALDETILPAIEDVVAAEIEHGLERAIRTVLPREISSVILDPDFTRSLAGSLVPTVEKTVTQLVLTGLVPSFKHTLHKSVDEIMDAMRGEMVGVRKEIVREQSDTVEKLEQEVGGLKREVGELKGMLERMEKLMLANSANQAQATPVRAPRATAPSSASSTSAFSPRSTTKSESLPPIPRTDTPPAKYEDVLTSFLQPSESPNFPSLVYFLNSSPSTRLDRIFPLPSTANPNPSPAISMAVTLSLAFRLSELIKGREGAFGPDEQKWLEWLRRAIGACNDQQPPEFLQMIPRIIGMVLTNLVTRGRSLLASSDHRSAGEIRIVEQYARARLSMFQ